jgi:hypothetical protein
MYSYNLSQLSMVLLYIGISGTILQYFPSRRYPLVPVHTQLSMRLFMSDSGIIVSVLIYSAKGVQ